LDDDTLVDENDYSPWFEPLPACWTIRAFKPEERTEKYKEVHYDSEYELLARILQEYRPHGKLSEPFIEHKIHFVTSLRSVFQHGARVMLVKSDTIGNGKLLFAKSYDPLFYPKDRQHEYWAGDALERAQLEFTREESAYLALKDLWGSEVPFFYGSYVFEVMVDNPDVEEKKRVVPLILTEYLEGGEWMHNMVSTWFNNVHMKLGSPEGTLAWRRFRMDVMVQIITTESKVFQRGVNHRDCRPANIYLVIDRETRKITRLVLVDFGQMERRDLPYLAKFSPLLRWQEATSRTIQFSFPRMIDSHLATAAWIDWPWETFLNEHWLNSADYFRVDPETFDEVRFQWRRNPGLYLVPPTDPSLA
jgi:hypothetical protein